MATPTSSKQGLQGRTPSQQGPTPSQLAGATPPISTPFSNPAQAAYSPRGQRSSPQQVKKSPATTGLLMGQSAAGAFNFDSPSTAAAMGVLVSGGFDIGLDGVGGLDSLGVGYGGEDDKLKRLDVIVGMLNEKKGFVSEAGLERLAQRLGLELLSEEQTTSGGRKTKTLALAGSAISLDIVLDNNVVQSVSLAYHGSATSVSRHTEAAGQILLRDLQLAPGQSPLTKTLDAFAANLERLATLDKLSVLPGLDCYEAMSGIYSSLRRLFDWDMARLRDDDAAGAGITGMARRTDDYLANMAMCCRHGRPVMHDRGRIGLALQYWREMRFIPPLADVIKQEGGEGVGGGEGGYRKGDEEEEEDQEKVWSLFLGCAAPAVNALDYPPVRVSEDWISGNVIKPSLDPTKPILDWLEPENVSLVPSEEQQHQHKATGMEVLQPTAAAASTIPRVMFTVAFDPPVILPQNDWIRLYSLADATPPNPAADFAHPHRPPPPPPTFDCLYFPIPPGSKQAPSDSRTITRLRDVRVLDERGRAAVRNHKNTLYIYKPIYSQEITEMPFSHPQQLIHMLPVLRQFAFLSTLLDNSFGPKKTREDGASSVTSLLSSGGDAPRAPLAKEDEKKADDDDKKKKPPIVTKIRIDRTADLELDRFMSGLPDESNLSTISKQGPNLPPAQAPPSGDMPGSAVDAATESMDLDVILWVHPSPHLQVVFPMRGSTANITLRILEGGTVEIVHENVLAQGGGIADSTRGRAKQLTTDDLGRVLEHLEDLCKWAEWIRTRL